MRYRLLKHKVYFPVILCLGLLGNSNCRSVSTESTLSKKNIPTDKDTITEKLAKTYSLQEAKVRFFPPESIHEFIIDGALPEFRICLYNHFSKEEYMNDTIRIKEYTWKKDENNNITVWYVFKDSVWNSIDLLVWPKDAEF